MATVYCIKIGDIMRVDGTIEDNVPQGRLYERMLIHLIGSTESDESITLDRVMDRIRQDSKYEPTVQALDKLGIQTVDKLEEIILHRLIIDAYFCEMNVKLDWETREALFLVSDHHIIYGGPAGGWEYEKPTNKLSRFRVRLGAWLNPFLKLSLRLYEDPDYRSQIINLYNREVFPVVQGFKRYIH
jgi:hypothetical protein